MREMAGTVALVIQLGAIVVAATLVPLLVGIWLDNVFHTMPWITLVAVAVGVSGALAAVYDVITSRYKQLD